MKVRARCPTTSGPSVYKPKPLWLPTRHSSNQSTPPPQPQQRRSLFLYSSLAATTGIIGGLLLSLYIPKPKIIQILYPEPTPVPFHVDSKEGKEQTFELEKNLQGLEIVKRLRGEKIRVEVGTEQGLGTSKNVAKSLLEGGGAGEVVTEEISKWTESRPYAATPPGPHSLSGYTLRGPGKFALPPLVFSSRDKRQAVFIIHLGSGLCGHEGIIHGGLLGTVLDESLGRTALLALPTNIGVTATLELSYKKPTFANQFVVIKTELVELKGRKAWVKGRIEDLDGHTLVEAKALFVEPKMARFLDNSSVREALK